MDITALYCNFTALDRLDGKRDGIARKQGLSSAGNNGISFEEFLISRGTPHSFAFQVAQFYKITTETGWTDQQQCDWLARIQACDNPTESLAFISTMDLDDLRILPDFFLTLYTICFNHFVLSPI